jgi:hypothetical protein
MTKSEFDKQLTTFLRAGGSIEVCSPRKLSGARTFTARAGNTAPSFLSSPPPLGATTSSVFRRY